MPSIRTSAASAPGGSTVPPCTIESYCSHTQRLLATFGEPSTARNASSGGVVTVANVGSSPIASSTSAGAAIGRV